MNPCVTEETFTRMAVKTYCSLANVIRNYERKEVIVLYVNSVGSFCQKLNITYIAEVEYEILRMPCYPYVNIHIVGPRDSLTIRI